MILCIRRDTILHKYQLLRDSKVNGDTDSLSITVQTAEIGRQIDCHLSSFQWMAFQLHEVPLEELVLL